MDRNQALEQLHAIDGEMGKLRAEREALQVRLRELQTMRDRAVATLKVLALSPAERATLAEVLAPAGVPSAEAVGTPGGVP